MNEHDESAINVEHEPGVETEASLSDGALLDLLDALVDQQGRVPAARVLGVNYRTLSYCCDSRQVSRRMRQALVDFHRARGSGAAEEGVGDAPPDADVEALRHRVAELEDENAELRELADERDRQLEELTRQLAALEDDRQSGDAAGVVDVEADADADGAGSRERGDGAGLDWQPPRRRPGMPVAGVVTLEEQPDEAHAFGPAAPLVAEWRQLRTGVSESVSRVDRAQAAVRRWELEARMLGEYRLTLPPETFPLDDARRREHVHWRRDALVEARRELRKARRARWLRRALTVGLWRR